LRGAGVDPWLDKDALRAGDDWQAEIEKAVDQADAFVVLLRPGFDDIGFRQREIRWARKALERRPPGRAFIIPYVVEPCDIPEWCRAYHVAGNGTRSTERNELLRAIEKHCGVVLVGEPLDPRLDAILRAVTDDQVLLLNSLASKGSPACPPPEEKGTWYASILLRPTKSRENMKSGLADVFVPIYFAKYEYNKLVATSSWMQTPQLLAAPLEVRDCCSGLPIRWYEESEEWQRDVSYEDLVSEGVVGEDELECLILRDVRRARYEMGNNLISGTYATDCSISEWPRGVGWTMVDSRSRRISMSQRVETEILVPIYDPASTGPWRGEDVLGVANFEWEQPHSFSRAGEIAGGLSRVLQDPRLFPISTLTCFILAQIIPPLAGPAEGIGDGE